MDLNFVQASKGQFPLLYYLTWILFLKQWMPYALCFCCTLQNFFMNPCASSQTFGCCSDNAAFQNLHGDFCILWKAAGQSITPAWDTLTRTYTEGSVFFKAWSCRQHMQCSQRFRQMFQRRHDCLRWGPSEIALSLARVGLKKKEDHPELF